MISQGDVLNVMREALTTVLISAAPLLLVAVVVGLLISIFQATTQIHEQTLAFVPKIVAVMLSLLIFGGFIFSNVQGFVIRLYATLESLMAG